MFYLRLDATEDIREARRMVGLTVPECISLCDITSRTWFRWINSKAPRWAIRLVLSQSGHLDHVGWKDWEIRGGNLYFNQLSYRYFWQPKHLVLPLYGVKDPRILRPAESNDILSNVVPLHKPMPTSPYRPPKPIERNPDCA